MAAGQQPGRSKPVSQLKTAEELCSLIDTIKRGRQRKEVDWRLNLAYARGNQYVYWNPRSKRIESVPVEDGEKPRYRVRIVSNQILNGTQSLLSKVIKTKPIFGATPGTPGDKSVKAAEFSEMLLEGWWRDMELASKYEEAVLWSIHAGSGFWKIHWDALANKGMRFLVNPQDGQPITDQALADEFRSQMEQAQVDPKQFEKVVYMGDLKIEVMSPFHVFGDPTVKNAHEWKWVICQHNLDPDTVKAQFGKDLKPNAVSVSPDQTLPMGNAEDAGEPNVVKLFYGYFLPTPMMPDGRYVVWSEEPKQILYDGPWPWKNLTMLPLVQFKGIRVPGAAEGDALTTHARPLQKQLNRMLSQITEYFNLTIRPQWMAPVNSIRTRMTNEPGVAWEYNPVGNTALKPEPVQLPAIPPYVFEFLKDLGARLRDVYGLTEVTEGNLPPNLEAADAIDLLQEMATDRFAPAIEANELSLARAGQIMLNLAQTYYAEPRLLTMRGFGGAGSAKEFSNADFAGDISVHVEAGSSLPRSRAARRKQIEQWMEKGILDPMKAWRYYDIADVKDIAMDFAIDEDQALREHEKLIKGIPLNPEAMQKAMAAVNQGMNPETQQPIQDPAEVQMILERAAVQPGIADNDSVHADKHKKYILSMEFEHHSPQVRQRFLTHYELTLQRLAANKPLPEPQAPRVSMQIKGAVGPSTMAEILQTSGVKADPQTLGTEPPMETMVIDSVDKPDADAGGAGQEANHLAQAAQTMIAADLANSEAQLRNARNSELHGHAVRKAAAEADLAEKKARQSFSPQPKAQSNKSRPKRK